MSRIERPVRRLPWLAVSVVALALGPGSVAVRAADLDEAVARIAADFKGDLGVYVKDLPSGRTFAHRADEVFATASAFKLAVLVELFRRAEAGEIRLDERRKLPRTGISRHGTGVLKHLRDDPELSLVDYARLMIGYSDNMATDVLMQVADARSTTATMKRLGFPRTRVSANCTTMHYRMGGIDSSTGSEALDALFMERLKAGKRVPGAGFVDRGANGNVTTPREMGTLYERLERGELVSPSASARMLEILKGNTSRSMIPRDLPPGTVVAHKNGGSSGVRTDAGIVYLAHGPVVVSIFSHAAPGAGDAGEALGRIAPEVVRWAQALESR